MALSTHGRSRRRLRLRPADEQERLLRLGDAMAGLSDPSEDEPARVPRHHMDSGRAAGGDGQPRAASTNGGTARRDATMPRLELERVDVPSDRPELDESAMERNRWLTLASAATAGLGALADSPELAKVGAGLTEGFSQNRARRLDAFYNELENFRERRGTARQENLARERLEAESNFEVRQGRQQEQQEHENALEEIERRYNKKLETIRAKRDREPTKWEKMQIRAEVLSAEADKMRAQQEKKDAQFGGGSGGSGGSGSDVVLPDTVEGVNEQLRYWRNLQDQGIQEMNTFGEPTRRRPAPDELDTIQRNINLLQRRKQQLQSQQGQGTANGGGAGASTRDNAGRGDGSSAGGGGGRGPTPVGGGRDTAQTAVERSRRAREAVQDTTGSDTSGSDTSGSDGVVQNERTAELRKRVLSSLQSEQATPSEIMRRAREAREAGALTRREFRKIEANYGQ